VKEIEVLKIVCSKLDQQKIPYMITGSFAANFYAIPRMTRDLDIVIEIKDFDIKKLLSVFGSEFYIDRDSISEAIKHQGMFNIIHNETIFKIDFIVRKDTKYREIEFQRKVQMPIDETHVWIVSPEDLVISKLDWGKDSASEMQIKDVKNLIDSYVDLDKEYIKYWVTELNLVDMYEKVGLNE